jgi:hypothetical protein
MKTLLPPVTALMAGLDLPARMPVEQHSHLLAMLGMSYNCSLWKGPPS